MRVFVPVLLTTSLICASGCQSAPKDAVTDTTPTQASTATDSVTPPPAATATAIVPSTPASKAPAVATKPLAQPKVPIPVKESGVAKPSTQAAADVAARAAAARADSLRQAQAKADAAKSATADSLRQAAARVVVRAETTATRPVAVSSVSAAQSEDGKVRYEETCRKCHGVRGVPPKTMKEKFPKIATFDAAFFAQHSADSIVTVLTKGKNEDMKSFKDKLTHAEMVAVAAYIRAFVQK